MRLAIFDTDIVVSAGIQPKSPSGYLILDWVLTRQVQPVTSRAVIHEYFGVTRRAKFSRDGFPPPWLDALIEESLVLPDPITPWPSEVPDATDVPFLALAKTSGAYLVTGKLKHFPEQVRHGVRVISPADYLLHLTANG